MTDTICSRDQWHSKNSDLRKLSFNELMEELADSEILVSFAKNKTRLIKNLYGDTGILGSQDIFETLIRLLQSSLECDVTIFRESFSNELREAVSKVLKRYNVPIDIKQGDLWPE